MPGKSDFTAISLTEFAPYQISRLSDQIGKRMARYAKDRFGLNLSHWRVMAALAEQPGRTANDVVNVTPMDKGIVSRAVKNLIDMELVTRKASLQDGRIGHLSLTAKGAKQYRSIASEARSIDQYLQTALDDKERKAFNVIMTKLVAASDEI